MGSPKAEVDATPQALRERNARLAQLANEFPAAQDALAKLVVAPKVEAAKKYDMGITRVCLPVRGITRQRKHR